MTATLTAPVSMTMDIGPTGGGRAEPRLATAPLRTLTPDTSLGFKVAMFARDVLGEPLLPWEEYAAVHGLELLPNGRFRFRTVLIVVARQNGKTHLSRVISLYKMFVMKMRLLLGVAQDLGIAREIMNMGLEMVEQVAVLAGEVGQVRKTNGDEYWRTSSGSRYMIKASTRRAGRSLSVDHLSFDELREQQDWLAWGALTKTMNARPMAQAWCMSNAGDDTAVVLNKLRASAGVVHGPNGVSVLVEPEDPAVCLLEWSAPEGCELLDPEGVAQANPALGYFIDWSTIASQAGTDPVEVYRTEVLCQTVESMNGALDLDGWKSGRDPGATMDEHRDRLALGVDVAMDEQHVTAVVAAELGRDRYRIEVVGSWSSLREAQAELGALRDRIRPRYVGWFRGGPVSGLATTLRATEASNPLSGVEITEACAGFASLVASGSVLHPGDPLLDAQVPNATKLYAGDGWRFARRGAAHVDAVYASAAAVHILRTRADEVVPSPMII